MRTGTILFSFLQVPRCRIDSLSNLWGGALESISQNRCHNSGFRFFDYKVCGIQRGYRKKFTQGYVTKQAEARNKTTESITSSTIKHDLLGETVFTSATVNVNKKEIDQRQKIQYCDIQQGSAENKDLASLVTIIVVDIETTGFSRTNERIIEIALRDLQGGENSTFQSLVNPERNITNSDVHKITNQMVNRPDVPRMAELIPILLQYVRSRQKPGGYVLWVAHNGIAFDFPFLMNEFSRCSLEFPDNWYFVDTRPLAREAMKAAGRKLYSISLKSLCKYYNIAAGQAHRAMSDVNALSLILQRLTFDLQLTIPGLVEKSVKGSDLNNPKKTKKNK